MAKAVDARVREQRRQGCSENRTNPAATRPPASCRARVRSNACRKTSCRTSDSPDGNMQSGSTHIAATLVFDPPRRARGPRPARRARDRVRRETRRAAAGSARTRSPHPRRVDGRPVRERALRFACGFRVRPEPRDVEVRVPDEREISTRFRRLRRNGEPARRQPVDGSRRPLFAPSEHAPPAKPVTRRQAGGR